MSEAVHAIRIAMWSGPRNISTALMRSWGTRGDTTVTDEPLYAHYLQHTGIPHPGADEVIAACECDWRKVVATLLGPMPGGKPIWYQKHMAHHLLSHIDTAWVLKLRNCLLIREPQEMLASLARVLPNPSVEQTGLPQQVKLFDLLRDATGEPPVIVAADVLTDPPGVLSALCERLGVAYTDAMLHWPPGPRPTDGVWAKHWYANVERSTGFERYTPGDVRPPAHLDGVLAECQSLYDELYSHRILAKGRRDPGAPGDEGTERRSAEAAS